MRDERGHGGGLPSSPQLDERSPERCAADLR